MYGPDDKGCVSSWLIGYSNPISQNQGPLSIFISPAPGPNRSRLIPHGDDPNLLQEAE